MSRLRIYFCILLMVLVGCPPERQADVPLPTRAVLPSNYQREDAERVARDYLTNWHDAKLDAMYTDLSFASQEANPIDSFTALYTTAQDTMTQQSVDVQANTIVRQRDEVAVFNYDVTFHT